MWIAKIYRDLNLPRETIPLLSEDASYFYQVKMDAFHVWSFKNLNTLFVSEYINIELDNVKRDVSAYHGVLIIEQNLN